MTNEKNEFKQNLDIDELMKQAAEKVDDDVKEAGPENEPKKSPKKIVIATAVGLSIFMAALIGGALLLKNQEEFKDNTKEPGWVSNIGGEKDPLIVGEWDFEYPIEVHEWAKGPFYVDTFWNEENSEAIRKEAESMNALTVASKWVPSGIGHGYSDPKGLLAGANTNDLSQKKLKNGKDNPLFSYALKEDYENAFVIYTERLLNPTFGDWVFFQRANKSLKSASELGVLKNMFTSTWWDENIKEGEDYSKLPILVDWNGDDWGGIQLAERETGRYGTFYGKIEKDSEKFTSNIIGDDENGMPIMEFEVPVEYSAFGKDAIITKKGLLTITLKSNSESITPSERVVINSAKLEIFE